MKAIVYHGPLDLRVEDIPIPEINAGDVLVKVLAASICGTDLRIYHGAHRKYPPGTVRVPGHEVVGVIEEVGGDVGEFSKGDTVFIAPNSGCGHCKHCIEGNNNICANYEALGVTVDGGFAEYMRVPAASIEQGNVIRIDPDVDPAVAALIEPFACVLRGQNVLHIQPGDFVLVVGAGPIGMMHAKLAKARGAAKVIISEVNETRCADALRLGADVVVNPTKTDLKNAIMSETGGNGADVIITAAPVHLAQEQALDLAASGGRINFFGGLPKDKPTINFDSNKVHYKELIVTGTTACSTADCFQAAQIINAGIVQLDEIVSKRFPLDEAKAAFKAAEDGSSMKVVFEPRSK